ncbi:MAG: Rieske 2Fe-2S domain-containing protein [Bacteroidota bacterium]
MGVGYKIIDWNPFKKRYDKTMAGLIVAYLLVFSLLSVLLYPAMNPQTLIIRAFGTLAIIMLHIILIIGPLARLDTRFLPLLYNRRHLGVTMFFMALIHSGMSIGMYHSLGDMDPISSIFLNNTSYSHFARFPFQPLGFFALIILFFMAVTSHDFWLNKIGPKGWKTLHMLVYVAYALIIMHVMLGIVQIERSPVLVLFLAAGMFTIIALHLIAGLKGKGKGKVDPKKEDGNFHKACSIEEIPEDCAKLVVLEGESIAIFKYENKISAIHNFCKHQNGPLSEGKIIDGCVTCPWHGYQYLPGNGQSPPPFEEKVSTYDVKVQDGIVWVNPKPNAEGTPVEPATF